MDIGGSTRYDRSNVAFKCCAIIFFRSFFAPPVSKPTTTTVHEGALGATGLLKDRDGTVLNPRWRLARVATLTPRAARAAWA